jgi:hypothetical protein
MVYVFPDPVCPYAKQVVLDLWKRHSIRGCTLCSYICRDEEGGAYSEVVMVLSEYIVEEILVDLAVFGEVKFLPRQ